MRKNKLNIKNKEFVVSQIVSAPRMRRAGKTNGHAVSLGINSRSFETRFIPRYKKIPRLPTDLLMPSFSESSNKILRERYLLKGGSLEVAETIQDRFWHIAYDIASGDFDFGSKEQQVYNQALDFYGIMVRQEFLPNSPTIMNAGKQNSLQYSACFVLPVGDSIEEIFDSVKYAALIHKSGGGTGFAFSRLRPKDSIVATTGGVASGPVSFLKVFNAATEAIKQGGCFSEDTLIMTHLGLIPIRDIIKQKRLWYATTHNGYQQITAKFDNGNKKLYQVKTQSGFTVKVTAEHKFLTSDKLGHFQLKPLADFQVGDHLTLLLGDWPKEIPYTSLNTAIPEKSRHSYGRIDINLPKYLDEKLAFLIGVYHADGSKISDEYSPNGKGLRIAVAEDRPLDLLKLTKTVKDVFRLDCTVTKGDGAVYSVNFFSRSLNEFLSLNGLLKESSVTVIVPDMIFTSPRSVVEAYIAGVFLGDGGNRGGKGGFRISTVSKNFAGQIQLLLLNLGIASKIASEDRQSKSWRDLYNVTINGNRFMKKFAAMIAPYTEKVNDHPISNRDYAFSWPFNLTEKYLYLSGIQSVTLIGNISTTQKTVAFLQQNIEFISEQHKNDIALLASCVSDKITSIEYMGEKNVYDLEVDNVHLLSGNGFYTSNSRRGANMGILRIDHPDILEFIRCKAELDDMNKPVYESVAPLLPDDSARKYFKTLLLDKQISNFNISCAITSKFMDALVKGEDYDLVDPHDWSVVGKLNAKQVFDEIVERAWSTGDPGLIFIDRINDSPANPVPSLETIESTNPCVTGDTLVATEKGWRRVDEIKNGDLIGTVLGMGKVDTIEVHEQKPVFKVKFSDGAEVRATTAHQFHAIVHEDRAKNAANKKFTPIRLDQLKVGDMVRVSSALMPDKSVADLPDGWSEKEYGFFIGVLIGDGCITETSIRRNVVKIAVNTKEKEWVEIIRNILQKAGSKFVSLHANEGLSASLTVQNSGGAALMVRQSLITPGYSYEKRIPIEYQRTNREFLSGILDGLFSTDGNVNLTSTHPFIRLKTTSKQLALDIRRILLCFGIHGRVVTIKKVADGHIGDRIIHSRHTQYEVVISGAGFKTFAEQISLTHPQKRERLQEARLKFSLTGNTWLAQIVSIEPDGMEKVYDLHEPLSDTWITEGIVSRGCGEQPLAPWDACNLGSINLGKFVLADGSGVDWEKLEQVTKLSVHFLDNVVQTNPYTLKQIYDEVHNNRRIGLGVMGWADMLFKLKIAYNSDQALELAEKVMKFVNEEGHKESESLALQRGPFPNWVNSIYADKKSSAFEERPASSAYGSGKPIRNSTVTTIAPTGTISIIGDCSSGIEPVFALAYIHRAKSVGDQYRTLTIANQTFEEIAKREGFWSSDLASKVMEHGSVAGLSEVPREWQDVFVTAPKIDPILHVKMQAAFQKYTDNGVSKTINLPNSATVEDVRTAYMLSYETGCSGITIYRDGSKGTQVLNVSSTLNKRSEEEQAAPLEPDSAPVAERPMILRGRTYKITTPVGEAFITINRDEGDQPFEVFITVGKGGMHTMADAEAMGRLVSLSLRLSRNGKETNPKEVAQKIAQQLRGIGGANHVGFGKNRVMSLADAIAKVLSEDLAVVPEPERVEQVPLNLTTNGEIKQSNGEIYDSSILAEPSFQLPISTSADLCPECGSASFVMEEGCKKCHSCGYSMC